MRKAIGIAAICGLVFGSVLFTVKEIKSAREFRCTSNFDLRKMT